MKIPVEGGGTIVDIEGVIWISKWGTKRRRWFRFKVKYVYGLTAQWKKTRQTWEWDGEEERSELYDAIYDKIFGEEDEEMESIDNIVDELKADVDEIQRLMLEKEGGE